MKLYPAKIWRRIFLVGITGMLICLFGVISGCGGNEKEQNEVGLNTVSAETVKAVQTQKTKPKTDIYMPITEQWATSKHANSVADPIKSGHGNQACYACHSADYFYNNGTKPPMEKMKNGITCIVCHKMTPSGLALVDNNRVNLCIKCHTAGKEVKPGKQAHHSQAEVFLGKGAIGIPESPNPKYQKGLACSDCHMPNQNHDFNVYTPSQAEKEHRSTICLMCHKDEKREEFAEKVDKLQESTETRTKKVLGQLDSIKKKLETAKAQGQNVEGLQKQYDIAYTNLSFVESDKSKGVHNPRYINAILTDSEKHAASLENALK